MPPKSKPAEAKAAAPSEDVSMTDAPEADSPPLILDEHNPAIMAFGQQRIRTVEEQDADLLIQLPGSHEFAASFEFTKEDHTLGNALRYIIMKNPDVEFCGYSIPHPSEELMNIRIQTYKSRGVEGTGANWFAEGTPTEALEKGLNDLIDLCDVVTEKFQGAQEEYGTKMKA
ncbi:DNA-directed RNA polymerases I and III subunit RPAC2 [Lachnellula suecica]|uniref:DNA-directed RNA polymerases I and III subunit RPAC2 n=1 Tax=Lachnellula suecica TaxID=602035 RepID=A0A8T9CI91_9HELO|nr:DNA-directed RNA polymerases I and III subunit RPAC2 [Lachnellula suecica]